VKYMVFSHAVIYLFTICEFCVLLLSNFLLLHFYLIVLVCFDDMIRLFGNNWDGAEQVPLSIP
jgi:hypothetical protein